MNFAEYKEKYNYSINQPEKFWAEQAENLDWMQKWQTVKNTSFANNDVNIRWFEEGQLNVSSNCIDRHLPHKADDIAFFWEPDESSSEAKTITYQQLHDRVCQLANGLKNRGVKKGDRVTIYMPMIPEAIFAMLACARIGAIHSVVFAGFSPDALADRIIDGDCETVITADHGLRGGKKVPLKNNVDKALEKCPKVHTVVVVNHTNTDVARNVPRDIDYHELVAEQPKLCSPEAMNAEDPLFILYTSGSTGKPKGVLHTTAGYLLYASITHKHVFNYKPGDIYWCTADIGWVTGHSYIVYGPLTNGATSVIFEGIPTYPNASRHWEIVDKYNVNIYYTAPTAIRALMACGNEFVTNTSRKSLKVLGTVGEPINPEAWQWYNEIVGEKKSPIVDTWWQTETGGIMITPLPGATKTKPGSATLPFFGIKPTLVDNEGNEVLGEGSGNLCIADSWPGQMRTVYGDHQRFMNTYFSSFENKYFTGDGCKRDSDGYYWITGRVDDVINVSGHRLGTAEIESSLASHKDVSEAAVVGCPHEIKGQGIYAYVVLNNDVTPNEEMKAELVELVKQQISPIAKPDHIQWATGLPKTRSGKIMRRILRKISANEFDSLGDISTLADPSVVEQLIAVKQSNA